jgi:hypothetical protein
MGHSSPRRGSITLPSDRLVAIVTDAGGVIDRAEALRRLAPITGVRETRSAVALALIGGRVVLTDQDALELSATEKATA